MDIKIASSEAKFGFVFARRGLVPEAGSAWFLPRLVGLDQALRWCLSGRVFGADEAKQGGLVSEVVAPDQLLARAREIAAEMVENTAPVSLALTRQMLWHYSGLSHPFEVMKIDGRALGRTWRRPRREGRRRVVPGKAQTEIPRQGLQEHARKSYKPAPR